MGIELHPKFLSLTEPRRYQPLRGQLLPNVGKSLKVPRAKDWLAPMTVGKSEYWTCEINVLTGNNTNRLGRTGPGSQHAC
jgi:hypothetical protein